MIKPFLPSEVRASRSNMLRTITRSVIAHSLSYGGGDAASVAEEHWPGDVATKSFFSPSHAEENGSAFVIRGVVEPTATTTANLSTGSPIAVMPLLQPASALYQLIEKSVSVPLGPHEVMNMPEFAVSNAGIAFTGEGSPNPQRQLDIGSNAIGSKTLTVGFVGTRELLESPAAEELIKEGVAADVTFGLETLLFDDVEGDAIRPTGLRYNLAATAASAAASKSEAMLEDLSALASGPVQLDPQGIIFVMAPAQYAAFELRRPSNFKFGVFPSGALAAGEVMCIAPKALAFSGSGAPTWRTSKHATIVERDDPTAFSTVGTPNQVAAPARSLFQTDSIALKITVNLDWLKRSSAALSWTENVTW